ncbi:MAG: DsbA family protein, partial [Pseudomonadota bacterium]|nr:DsbA family protein [Pseudomonadota bacterium]
MNIRRFLVASTTACVLAITCNTTIATAASFTPEQQTQIEKIVHDYLLKKPELLVEVSVELQKKQQAEETNKARSAIVKNAGSLLNSPNSPAFGSNKPTAVIVEFLDYQCGHCKSMSPILGALVKKDDKLRVVIKGLPIFGDTSKLATQAVIAAAAQNIDKFVKFHEALLNTKEPLNEKNIMNLAKAAGLNVDKLKKDMAGKIVNDQIAENFTLARELGLRGTPVFIISNSDASKTDFIPGGTTAEDLSKSIAKV